MTAVSMPVMRRRQIVAWSTLDADDAELVGGRRLSLSPNGYVRIRHDGENTYLHRLLLGLKAGDGREVDHMNRDRLDNRRCNLRIVAPKANRQNVSGRNRTSKYRGVSWSHSNRGWIAQAHVDGRTFHLGTFPEEDVAASVAREFRVRNMPASVETA